MLMSRLCTDGRTDGNVKVEQYSAEAESAISHLPNLRDGNSTSKSVLLERLVALINNPPT